MQRHCGRGCTEHSQNQKAMIPGTLSGTEKGPGGKTEEISMVGPVWTLEAILFITWLMTPTFGSFQLIFWVDMIGWHAQNLIKNPIFLVILDTPSIVFLHLKWCQKPMLWPNKRKQNKTSLPPTGMKQILYKSMSLFLSLIVPLVDWGLYYS